MVKLIRQTNATDLPHTDIREFAFINENLRDVMQSNKRILQSLSEQSSLLTYLGYMNQLKNIPPTGRLQQLTFHNNPYRLVLFRLHFKPRAGTPGDDLDFDKAGYFIKEYIDRTFRGAPELPESLTFQMAADQIVALAFIGEQEQVQDPLPSLLARLNDVFKNDEAFYFVTICVSSVYRQSSELTGAYEQTLQMLESRKLNEESQIIDKPEQRKADIVFHGSELQKFEANLAAGNHSAIVTIVEQLFRALHKKQSWAADYRRLAEEVVDSVIKCAKTSNVGLAEHLTRWEPYRATADFHTVEQYIGFFEQFLPEAARLFVLNQEALVQDKTIRFVIDYLDRHYMETIFVDMLAEKLNLTGGYLSSYFKSKTGTNLTDYVNQLRVSKAKALLTDPQLKIQNVAEQVGYQNINTFIRTFKRYTGYTPGDYRKTI
jgi:AraC-like DNA-binding protein